MRSGIDECLIHPGPRANLEGLNDHRTALGMVTASQQSVGKLNGRLVILLDLSKVLQRGELKRIAETEDGAIAAALPATLSAASQTTPAAQTTQATQKKGSKPAPGKQNGVLASK